MEIEIAVAVFILFAIVFLATVDMAFSQLSDVSLRRLLADLEETPRRKTFEFLQQILENRPRFRFALSATIQILLILFSVLVTIIVLRFFQSHAELLGYSILIGLTLSVLFRQVIPWLLTWKDPEKKLLLLLPFVRPLYEIVPFIADPVEPSFRGKIQTSLENTLSPNGPTDAEREDAADDFQALMEVGEAEGIIEESERELIETMVEFSETRAGEIMTPRTEICALPFGATVRQARDLINEEKYSRMPVYRDSIDNIEGVIYVRDLMQAWADGKENESIAAYLRSAYFVPETKSAADLLKAMQSNHVQIAVVVDEYGGVAGLVTLEDIIEEIVGEIEDEDIEEEEIVEIIEADDGYFDVPASVEIGKIEKIFDIEIDDDEVTTIAGLVISEAGYVPRIGERIELHGLEVEILGADEKRLLQLRIRKITESDESDSENV
ncbi:MAG: HlyC/CorC family transporter [Acidobacteria bacterium]|nr:HlyC/CorC family transporter [Acidobacteriota bacterium]MBK8149007.1 HlyC/CorC family transporter [Acidobacteriota bacterium]MBK8811635.1 HlyC/CorC family transporter [Acidobacteriota bacterium]